MSRSENGNTRSVPGCGPSCDNPFAAGVGKLHQVVERARGAVQIDLIAARLGPARLPARLDCLWVVFGVHLGPPWLMIESIPSRVRPPASWHIAICRRAGGARQGEGSASVFWNASTSS